MEESRGEPGAESRAISRAEPRAEPTSSDSNAIISHQPSNGRRVQNAVVIWFDSNFDENISDYRNTMAQLRSVSNNINVFTDSDECIEYINTIVDDKIFMILPGYLGRDFVPRIHNMSQIDSIFIFCDNEIPHERYAEDWFKIKGIFTEVSTICEALKQADQQYNQNAIPISFVVTSGDMSKKDFTQLDPSYMYTQILKEILLTITFEQGHMDEFIDYCRETLADNKAELKNVDKVQQKYREKTPIWWYTYESFLYPMLNRALRLMDVNIIIKMGFFISDLHRHIAQLHSDQFGDHHTDRTFTVYRGQGMPKTYFEQMTESKGGLISFNNFLSTSRVLDVSLSFARRARSNPDLVGILFVMTIDPSKSTTPFASIDDVSYFGGKEDEILFAMHTVFRIRDIKPMDETHRIFQVDLTLTSDEDHELRALTEHIQQETFPNEEGWYRLGKLLLTMGRPEEAEQVYQIILKQATDESEMAPIYHQLGWAKKNQGKYKDSIMSYEKALEIDKKTLPPNHPDLAMSYNGIGNVYAEVDDYWKALAFYEKALEIREQSLPPNHLDLASSYNNIGNVYNNMEEYSKALSYYEKDLKISEYSLPPNHPDLAASYNNMGSMYDEMGEYSKALSYYEHAVDIAERSLPPDHYDLKCYRNNLERVKDNL